MHKCSRAWTVVAAGCWALASAATFAASSPQPKSDAEITDQVAAKLAQESPDLAQRVKVTTHDGVVTLSGSAESGELALKALNDAHRVPGVTQVRNRMKVVM